MRANLDFSSRLYNREFATAFASKFCFVIAMMLMSHYARWIVFLGGTVQDVGWIIGGGAVAAFLIRPLAGSCIDRFGAHNVWLVGLLISLVALLSNLWIQEIDFTIYVARAVLFVGASSVFTSGLTYITQRSPAARRTEAIGTFGSAGFIAMTIAPLVGDAILGSGDRSRADFLTLFYVSTAATVLSIALLIRVGAGIPARRTTGPFFSASIKSVWKYWPGPVTLVSFAFGMCLTVPFVFLATYVDDLRLETPFLSPVGLFFLGYGGWGLVVRLGMRRVPDRLGRRKVLLAGLTLNSIGLFCFLAIGADNPWMLLLPGLLCGTGHALSMPTASALVLEPFPDHFRGMGCTLSLMIADSGAILGAPLLGMIAERTGYTGMFITAGCVSLAAMLYLLWNTIPIWMARREMAIKAAGAVVPNPYAYKVLRSNESPSKALIDGELRTLDRRNRRGAAAVDDRSG